MVYYPARGHSLGSFSLRVEIAEVLLLRGVLSHANYEHAKLLPPASQRSSVVDNAAGNAAGDAVAPCATFNKRMKLEAPARRRVHTKDRVHDLTGDSSEDDEIQLGNEAKEEEAAEVEAKAEAEKEQVASRKRAFKL
eukprot:jgi/Chlat1/3631/Chrsp237S03609